MRMRPAAAVALCGTLLLYLACTPLVATLLSRSLERMTPYLRPEDAPRADAIVVLGGGQSAHVASDGSVHLQGGRGADRLDVGIRAFKAGKAPLLVMGGGSFGITSGEVVGDYLASEAVNRGIPADAILACGDAKFSTDEGAAVAAMLNPRHAHTLLLCTSATHLPRARLIYQRLGFEVVCIPCDFDTRGGGEGFSPLMLVPRGQALTQTENAVKEWLGLTVMWVLDRD